MNEGHSSVTRQEHRISGRLELAALTRLEKEPASPFMMATTTMADEPELSSSALIILVLQATV